MGAEILRIISFAAMVVLSPLILIGYVLRHDGPGDNVKRYVDHKAEEELDKIRRHE
jgi:hypothetical protein